MRLIDPYVNSCLYLCVGRNHVGLKQQLFVSAGQIAECVAHWRSHIDLQNLDRLLGPVGWKHRLSIGPKHISVASVNANAYPHFDRLGSNVGERRILSFLGRLVSGILLRVNCCGYQQNQR